MRGWIAAAALNGFLAVALGAFGAHGIRGRVSERAFAAWQTGAQYHQVHALAMLGAAALAGSGLVSRRGAGWALALWQAGIAIFAGSLYVYGATEAGAAARWAPVGGTLLMAGWIGLALAARAGTEPEGSA